VPDVSLGFRQPVGILFDAGIGHVWMALQRRREVRGRPTPQVQDVRLFTVEIREQLLD
jgi:hypothetical protein